MSLLRLSHLRPFFPLTIFGICGRNFQSFLPFYLTSRSLIYPGSDTTDELARRGALLQAFTQSLVDYKFLQMYEESSLLYAYCPHKIFRRIRSSASTEELVLPRHAHSTHSRPRCKGDSFLSNSYLSRIGEFENFYAAPAIARFCNLISFCFVQLRTPCATRASATSFLYATFAPGLKIAWILRLHGLPPFPYPSERVG